jgi:hypothetical protein
VRVTFAGNDGGLGGGIGGVGVEQESENSCLGWSSNRDEMGGQRLCYSRKRMEDMVMVVVVAM